MTWRASRHYTGAMKLTDYLARVHFSGSPRPDLATLRQLHHLHLRHIPYENADVQLGTPLNFDIDRIFDKLVHARRGGWCYEMNGLLGWALDAIGFSVRRMSGAVNRASEGDRQLGNHLLLEVDLGEPWLADVGLGDGLREPVPIREGKWRQRGLTYRLERLPDGYWRFHNHAHSAVTSFDFRHAAADETELSNKCGWLQSAPESPFRMVFIAQRFGADHIDVQLGKVASRIEAGGKTSREIDTLDAFHGHLRDTFGLDVDLSPVWPEICAAHDRFFGTDRPPTRV